VSGLHLIGNKPVGENAATLKGRLLKSDQSYTLVCSVRSGQIDMSVNGKTVVSYKGPFETFSLHDWDRVPNPKALFLFVNKEKTSYRIDRVVVRTVKGRGAIRK
jgi:hypothetical protein